MWNKMEKNKKFSDQNLELKSRFVIKFQKNILKWFEKHQRTFPWREKSISSYQILIAEVLLQKTRAENITEVYLMFINRYKNIEELAKADANELIELLKPLGFFNRRTRDFLKMSKEIMIEHRGHIPHSKSNLEDLPGIGPYIANAYLCVAHNQRLPIVDTNVKRLYSRFFGISVQSDLRRDKYIWNLAEQVLPKKNYKKFNWAVLDLTAKICKSKSPEHKKCPLNKECAFLANIKARDLQ